MYASIWSVLTWTPGVQSNGARIPTDVTLRLHKTLVRVCLWKYTLGNELAETTSVKLSRNISNREIYIMNLK